MAGKILVALKRNDRLEEVIPYIEKVAQPGMKFVFLIQYPLIGAFEWLRDRMRGEFPEEAAWAEKKIFARYSGEEEERRLAEHKIFLAQQALRKRGVEIVVDVYTGPLRKAVDSYRRQGDLQLIMMRMGSVLRIQSFLHGAIPLLGIFRRPSFSHMLLLHPGAIA